MHISRIFIRNFRSFRHLDVAIGDGVTCFIGENNCGKTNLFHALRLVLDGNISSYRRRLSKEDLSAGLIFSTPEHVLIAVEFAGFVGKPNEEALLFSGIMQNGRARISYRFRPKPIIREEHENTEPENLPTDLKMTDYVWEMAAGGDHVDLDAVTWKDSFGTRFNTDNLHQGYLVVFMEALRDVETRLAASRTSPLQQIIEQCDIPQDEQDELVLHMQEANDNINGSDTINNIGTELSDSFLQTAGPKYTMGIKLGLGEPSFTEITRGLRVLLSGYGLENLDPSRNGLGLNNILYVSLLLNYFLRRIAKQETAGQLLLVEEPEAHLHPQLQRILLATLQQKQVQVFITTHSTHITSGVPLLHHVVLTSGGGPATQSIKPSTIAGMTAENIADLDRYLDATRSSLLYARKVLLVEGPAEQFLLPPLIKKVMGIDLDEEGIAVIPIYGTHFKAYTRLFGPEGIQKKCAVVADGDLVPSDANPEVPVEEEDGVAPGEIHDLDIEENKFVNSFQCDTTFERELTLAGTLEMFRRAATEIGAPQIAALLQEAMEGIPLGEDVDIEPLKDRVLNTAKRFGKARFAQLSSKYANTATELPEYITNAVNWLINDAAD
jgi:putative ATP-dependent endonuclease of OLD family